MQDSTKKALGQLVKDAENIAAALRSENVAVIASRDAVDLIKHFNDLRDAVDMIKTSREALNDMVDTLSTQEIPTLFANRDIKTINVEGVGRVTVSYRFSASMLDKSLGFDWLRSNGHGDLITETVNSSTLAAFAKTYVQDGKDLPEDVFKVSTSPYTSITKR